MVEGKEIEWDRGGGKSRKGRRQNLKKRERERRAKVGKH